MISILVPEDLSKDILRRLGNLARKCGVSHEVIPGTTLWAPYGHAHDRVECVRVTVSEFPRANGWTFVAKIEHTAAGNLISCAPGETLDESYRTVKAHCDHCNTQRGRTETFVIRSPEGELKQIGRNCLADFVQCDATALISAAEMSAWFVPDPDSEWFGCGWGASTSTDWYVACALASTEKSGFVKSGGGGSTRNAADFISGPPPSGSSRESMKAREEWKAAQPTEEQVSRAQVALEWARTNEDRSDYMYNLRIAASLPTAAKHEGLLASLPYAHQKHLGKVTARAEKPGVVSEHVGTVGKRAEWLVTYRGYSTYEGDYGTVRIMRFETAEGAQIVWFCSGSPEHVDEGSQCWLKATVKRHDERKGVKQTIVSHGTLRAVEPAPEAVAV